MTFNAVLLQDGSHIIRIGHFLKLRLFWFTAGSLAQCRIYSKVLALQIKAIEEGLIGKEAP